MGPLNDLGLVDRDLLPLLDLLETRSLTTDNLAACRRRTLPLPPPGTTGVDVDVMYAPSSDGSPDIQLRVYRPAERDGPLACVYHMHGGGYVMGNARELEGPHRHLAVQLGCVIISVEYRLAPETRFPGAIEDCYAGLAWLFDNAPALGVDRNRIGLMGESAGGGLAAALAILSRDRGGPPIAFQHLIYPMIDDRTGATAHADSTCRHVVWNAQNNLFAWTALLGHEPGVAGVSPYAAASRADDVSGLPPAFLSVGALDLFVDENIEYAGRLLRAGVPVELHVYPGAFHGFELSPTAAVSRIARRDSREALRRFMRDVDADPC